LFRQFCILNYIYYIFFWCYFSLFRSLFLKLKIEKYANVIGEIVHGLNKFNLVHQIRKYPSVFKLLFCKSNIFTWTINSFLEVLSIHWSTHGSNEKKVELETYKAFREMLEISFYDGEYICIPWILAKYTRIYWYRKTLRNINLFSELTIQNKNIPSHGSCKAFDN
jgi:hypothetical protein